MVLPRAVIVSAPHTLRFDCKGKQTGLRDGAYSRECGAETIPALCTTNLQSFNLKIVSGVAHAQKSFRCRFVRLRRVRSSVAGRPGLLSPQAPNTLLSC